MQADQFYKKYKWLIIAVAGILSFLIYANTKNHEFALDDSAVIVYHKSVQQGSAGLGEIFTHGSWYGFDGTNANIYRPITLAAFAIEKEWFGGEAGTFHRFSIFYYSMLCILLSILSFKLFKDYRWYIPASISLLFVAHPVHSEVVANIKSRDEIFVFLFFALSLLLLLKYVDTKKLWLLIVSGLFYLLSLLSKENAVTFIVLFPAVLYFFKGFKIFDSLKHSIAFAVPLVIYFLLRITYLEAAVIQDGGETLNMYNNALYATDDVGLRISSNFSYLLKYFQLSIFPVELTYDYSYNQLPLQGWGSISVIIAVLILGLMVFGIVKGFKTRSKIAFGLLFFLVTLSVSSNFFILIAATIGERFLFVPSFGAIMVLVLGINYGLEKIKFQNLAATFYLSIVLSAVFAYVTVDRNPDWYDDFTLKTNDVKVSSRSAKAQVAAGNEFRKRAEASRDNSTKVTNFQAAVMHYDRAIEIYPGLGKPYYNRAIANHYLNKLDLALADYIKVIEVDNGNVEESLINASQIYSTKKNHKKAEEYLLRVINMNDSSIVAIKQLGLVYFDQKDYSKALKTFQKVNPLVKYKDADVWANLGAAAHFLGDKETAIKGYSECLKINPNHQMAKGNIRMLQ